MNSNNDKSKQNRWRIIGIIFVVLNFLLIPLLRNKAGSIESQAIGRVPVGKFDATHLTKDKYITLNNDTICTYSLNSGSHIKELWKVVFPTTVIASVVGEDYLYLLNEADSLWRFSLAGDMPPEFMLSPFCESPFSKVQMEYSDGLLLIDYNTKKNRDRVDWIVDVKGNKFLDFRNTGVMSGRYMAGLLKESVREDFCYWRHLNRLFYKKTGELFSFNFREYFFHSDLVYGFLKANGYDCTLSYKIIKEDMVLLELKVPAKIEQNHYINFYDSYFYFATQNGDNLECIVMPISTSSNSPRKLAHKNYFRNNYCCNGRFLYNKEKGVLKNLYAHTYHKNSKELPLKPLDVKESVFAAYITDQHLFIRTEYVDNLQDFYYVIPIDFDQQ